MATAKALCLGGKKVHYRLVLEDQVVADSGWRVEKKTIVFLVGGCNEDHKSADMALCFQL